MQAETPKWEEQKKKKEKILEHKRSEERIKGNRRQKGIWIKECLFSCSTR